MAGHFPSLPIAGFAPVGRVERSARMKRSSYGERDYAFGQSMLTLRTTLGLTQAELADRLDVSRRAVGEWEVGSSYPKAEHLKALRRLAVHFQVVIFRSLRDAPACETLVEECLKVLAPQPLHLAPADLEHRLSLLLQHLREQRVLLVLDNLESLLLEGEVLGHLRSDYEGYARLLRSVAQTAHQSCLLLTSREKAAELRALEGRKTPVRCLRLLGLAASACEQLLAEHELLGSP